MDRTGSADGVRRESERGFRTCRAEEEGDKRRGEKANGEEDDGGGRRCVGPTGHRDRRRESTVLLLVLKPSRLADLILQSLEQVSILSLQICINRRPSKVPVLLCWSLM